MGINDEVLAAQLRRRAEGALASRPARLLSGESDVWRSHHELQVHQIELEMQNAALQQTTIDLFASCESELRFSQFMEHLPACAFIKDPQGRHIFVNAALARLGNTTVGALLGKTNADLWPPEIAAKLDSADAVVINSGSPLTIEEDLLLENGMRTYRSTKFPIKRPNGETFLAGVSFDITDLKQTESALRKSQEKIHLLLHSTGEAIYGIDMLGNCTFCNRSCLRLLGYKKADELLGKNMHRQIHAKHRDGTDFPVADCRIFQALNTGIGNHVDDEVLWRADGTAFPAEYWSSPQHINGKVVGAVVTFVDITERKQTEAKLQLAASVFTHAREGITITDADGTIIDVNDTFTRMTGYAREEVIGRNSRILGSGRQGRDFYAALWRDLIDKGHWSGEIWNRRKNGEVYAEMLTISAVRDEGGKTCRYVALCSDITERKQMEDQIHRLAFYDSLTTLPNRRLLSDRLQQSMAANKRSACFGALMFIDLDNFKPLNDAQGHELGDLLLIEVANRLKGCVREMDTVARFGGDEFVVMISELSKDREESTALVAAVAEKVRGALSRLYPLTIKCAGKPDSRIEHHCTASIGVALFVNHQASQDEIIKWADTAMYQAKKAGRNTIRFHEQPE